MKQDILFNILIILFCMLLIFIQSKKKSGFIGIIQLQNYIWLVGFLIYLFRVVKYYPLNDTVYYCSFLYLLFCNIAGLIRPKYLRIGSIQVSNLSCSIDEYQQENRDRLREFKCIVASLLCWIISIPILKKSIPILIQYGSDQGLNALRYRTYGEFTIFSTPEMVLITYIIRPIFTVTIIYFAQQIAQKKITKSIAFIAIMDALWLIIATAGRALIVSMIIYIALATVAINGSNILRLIKQYKKYIIPAFVLLIVFIQIISKRVNKRSFIEEGIIYFFSGLSYFSTMLNQGIAEAFSLFGKGMLSFLIDPVVLGLKIFGVSSFSGGSQYLSTLANAILPIGENLTTNATASTLLTFYSDFGIIGAAVGGILIGRLAVHVESRLEQDFCPVSFGRYLFVISGIVVTFQNYPFVGSVAMMTWIFLGILLK